jgi:phage terminase large subunit-like protein
MRYFFNLAGAIYDADVEGYELPTFGDARIMAAKHASEILRDRPGAVWEGEELRVEVTDSQQIVLFTLIILGVDNPASEGKG